MQPGEKEKKEMTEEKQRGGEGISSSEKKTKRDRRTDRHREQEQKEIADWLSQSHDEPMT